VRNVIPQRRYSLFFTDQIPLVHSVHEFHYHFAIFVDIPATL
jgi:hypothetical protein